MRYLNKTVPHRSNLVFSLPANTKQPPHSSAINIIHHPHTWSSTCLPLLSNAFCSSTLRGKVLIWVPALSSKWETVILIEDSIGEPFNKSGNGIQLCINVLRWGKRSHHHFSVQAVLKQHLACRLSRPWEQNDIDFFFVLCTLYESFPPNIFYGYFAFFPTHPSAPLPDLGGERYKQLYRRLLSWKFP